MERLALPRRGRPQHRQQASATRRPCVPHDLEPCLPDDQLSCFEYLGDPCRIGVLACLPQRQAHQAARGEGARRLVLVGRRPGRGRVRRRPPVAQGPAVDLAVPEDDEELAVRGADPGVAVAAPPRRQVDLARLAPRRAAPLFPEEQDRPGEAPVHERDQPPGQRHPPAAAWGGHGRAEQLRSGRQRQANGRVLLARPLAGVRRRTAGALEKPAASCHDEEALPGPRGAGERPEIPYAAEGERSGLRPGCIKILRTTNGRHGREAAGCQCDDVGG
mmetsp:Transcript_42630/g.120615  ORF Transcript_42630/g.120615 Transcript_42630/m.120615 type:complete len:275 (-) Transcript_42630:963-1787(-)